MWKMNSIRGKKRPIFKKVLLKQTSTTQMAMPEYIVTSNDKSILRQGIGDYCCCLLWHKPDARRIISSFDQTFSLRSDIFYELWSYLHGKFYPYEARNFQHLPAALKYESSSRSHKKLCWVAALSKNL